MKNVYRGGRLNSNADALSRSPLSEPGTQSNDPQIFNIESETTAMSEQAGDPAGITESPATERNHYFATEQERNRARGVLKALLSDRGTNLLSHLMCDICALLGITKLNTTHNVMAWWNVLKEP